MSAAIGLGLNYKEFLVGMKRVEAELKGFKKTADGWSKNLASMGSAAAGLFATNQFGNFLKSASQKAMESELNIKKLNAVLAATGGAAGLSAEKLDEISASLSSVTNFSKATILEAERIVLTFKGIKGDNFEKTMNLAADMADTFQMQLPQAATMLSKALEMPSIGLKNLRRVGVSFTEAQTEMIKSMDAAGNKAGAQAEIFKILQGQFGGVASAAGDTASGKLLQFEKTINGIKKSIGELVMTAITPMIDVLQKAVNWYRELDKPAKTIITGIVAMAAAFAALTPIVIGITGAVGMLSVAFTALNVSTGGLLLVLGAVIAGAAGVAVAINAAMDKNKEGQKKQDEWVKNGIKYEKASAEERKKIYKEELARRDDYLKRALDYQKKGEREQAKVYGWANLVAKRSLQEYDRINKAGAQSFEDKATSDTRTISGIANKLKELRAELETTASTSKRVELLGKISYWEDQQKAMQETGKTLEQLRTSVEGMEPVTVKTVMPLEKNKPQELKLRANVEMPKIDGELTKWDLFKDKIRGVFNGMEALSRAQEDNFSAFMSQTNQQISTMADYGQAVANAIRQTIKAYLAEAIAKSIAAEAGKGLLGLVTASIAGVSFAALFENMVPKFAAGGIATRPTLGIFGEAGPEALVPLNRAGMMGFGGGNVQVSVVGQIQGRELRIVNKYADRAYQLKTGRR